MTETQERTGSLGFESKLWEAADLLRNNMDPAEYKHVVLGLLFLKYIEDAFDERREQLRSAVADPNSVGHQRGWRPTLLTGETAVLVTTLGLSCASWPV